MLSFEHQQTLLPREIHYADKKAGAVGKVAVLWGLQHRQLFPSELLILKCIIYVVYVIKKEIK